MPYIVQERRLALLHSDDGYEPESPQNAGELNYVLTLVILDYLAQEDISYQRLNDISGALTECLAEFRRRITGPYESIKAHKNGDVYQAAMEQVLEQTRE